MRTPTTTTHDRTENIEYLLRNMTTEVKRLAKLVEESNRKYEAARRIMLNPHWDSEDYQHFISGSD